MKMASYNKIRYRKVGSDWWEFRHDVRVTRAKIERCKNCGLYFPHRRWRDQHFCSRKCALLNRKQIGERQAHWKGYRKVDNEGYVWVWLAPLRDKRPRKDAVNRGGSWRIKEHRLVMGKHLGRPIKPNEQIHHKNGIRSDNRIENLELWDRQHPSGVKVEDIVVSDLPDYLVKAEIRYPKGCGPNNPRWKGPRRIGTHGYAWIYLAPLCMPKPHPEATRMGNAWRRREHRIVMEQKLGRPLKRDEYVHHINGIKHDNRPENLELWAKKHPSGKRVKA